MRLLSGKGPTDALDTRCPVYTSSNLDFDTELKSQIMRRVADMATKCDYCFAIMSLTWRMPLPCRQLTAIVVNANLVKK